MSLGKSHTSNSQVRTSSAAPSPAGTSSIGSKRARKSSCNDGRQSMPVGTTCSTYGFAKRPTDRPPMTVKPHAPSGCRVQPPNTTHLQLRHQHRQPRNAFRPCRSCRPSLLLLLLCRLGVALSCAVVPPAAAVGEGQAVFDPQRDGGLAHGAGRTSALPATQGGRTACVGTGLGVGLGTAWNRA